jgi:toxin ParE1/3/4
MAHFHVLPAADRDLDDQAAFYDAANTTFEALARMPGMGERRESRQPRLAGMRVGRVEGFENHLIYYRPVEGGIEIVRVLHGARDIDRALESDRFD